MSAKIIDGKKLQNKLKEELKLKVNELNLKGIYPSLAVVIIGNHYASLKYVSMKKDMCHQLGIISKEFSFSDEVGEAEVLNLISQLNSDDSIHGILVQLPLPKHIDENKVISQISPFKDVDGFHPISIGHLFRNVSGLRPCTPAGVIELIQSTGVEIAGKECVIVGRSNIVGKPQGLMLLNLDATVTYCHSKTKNIKEICKRADILVVAVGKSEWFNDEYVKEGAIVIDVGINKNDAGKMVGDVEFTSVSKKAAFISPVPGGVGPMTIIMLMKNTLEAAMIQKIGEKY